MSPSSLFTLANPLAALGWLLLVAALFVGDGALRRQLLALAGRVLPLLLSLGYIVLLLMYWGSAPGGGFSGLDAVDALFRSPGLLLAGWVHYLAFDLFIGRWIVDDALRRGFAARLPLALALVPVLALTFMFGPAGLLLWFVVRSLRPLEAGHAD